MRRLFVAIGLLTLASASFAVPIRQDITFTPSLVNGGPAGVGSLVWDSETLLLSEVTWDFGLGRAGGISPSILGAPLQGYTWGALLYEQMTGLDIISPPFTNFSFGTIFGNFPSTYSGTAIFGTLGLRSYEFVSWSGPTREVLATGTLTVATRGVPEPGTWALLVIGLAGIFLARRKAVANY
jgi:hypothetical protein